MFGIIYLLCTLAPIFIGLGVVYPVCGVIYYKAVRHDKDSVWKIMGKL